MGKRVLRLEVQFSPDRNVPLDGLADLPQHRFRKGASDAISRDGWIQNELITLVNIY
jgi:hypothetical protein